LVIRWGVVGAGDASRRFAQGLAHVPEVALTAIWTRRLPAAQVFAASYGGNAFAQLNELLQAPIDAIYIGTHPDSHLEYSLAALRAGKHVLCEKPSMLNQRELDQVLAEATARNLLFMEAMKPPFFPVYRRLREHLAQDPIGQVGFVRAGSSLADLPPEHPIYNLHLGGGSLLGIAPYEAFLALDWLGPVRRIETIGRLDSTGIDTFASLQTQHQHGIAQLYSGLGLHGHGDALLAAPLGNVSIPAKWWNPDSATIRYLDGRVVELHEPIVASGFNYETEHFCEMLRAGKTESPILTHEVSRQMMQILDSARATLGLAYPQEVS
jgi:scyllo-inositol 2-dehydrogenase (NADP+)